MLIVISRSVLFVFTRLCNTDKFISFPFYSIILDLKADKQRCKGFFKRVELAQLIIQCCDLTTRDFGGAFFLGGLFFRSCLPGFGVG